MLVLESLHKVCNALFSEREELHNVTVCDCLMDYELLVLYSVIFAACLVKFLSSMATSTLS